MWYSTIGLRLGRSLVTRFVPVLCSLCTFRADAADLNTLFLTFMERLTRCVWMWCTFFLYATCVMFSRKTTWQDRAELLKLSVVKCVRISLNCKKQQNERKDLLKYVGDYIVVCWEFYIKLFSWVCVVPKGGTEFLPALSVFVAKVWAKFCADVYRMSALRIGATEGILCVMA